jgi:hypothetical protein
MKLRQLSHRLRQLSLGNTSLVSLNLSIKLCRLLRQSLLSLLMIQATVMLVILIMHHSQALMFILRLRQLLAMKLQPQLNNRLSAVRNELKPLLKIQRDLLIKLSVRLKLSRKTKPSSIKNPS